MASDPKSRGVLARLVAPATRLVWVWMALFGFVGQQISWAGGPASGLFAPGNTTEEAIEQEEEDPDYLRLADEHLQAGEFLQAISAYQLALIEDPQDHVAWFGLAMAQYEAGQVQEAIGSYKEALQRNPALWQAEMNLGVIWFNQKNFGQALTHFERAQTLSPQSWRPFFLAGETHLLQDNLPAAEASFKQALDLTEAGAERAAIHPALVSIYLSKKDYSSAAKHLMASRPFSKDIRENDRQLASLYLEMGQKQKALEYLDRLATDPSADPELHETIGWIRVDQNDYAGGIKSLRIALERQPDAKRREELCLELAKLHVRLEQIEEARAVLEKGASGSANPELHFMLGSLYLHTNQWEPAKRSLAQALHLNSDCVECYGKLGAIYMKQEDFGRAIPLLSRYRDLKPEKAMTYFYLGVAYDRLRRYRKAVPEYEKFLEMDQGKHDRESFQVRQRVKGLKKRVGGR